MNVLVVAAHPDDEVLGCGGTIAARVAENANVYLAIMTRAAVFRYGIPPLQAQQVREAEARAAAEVLGITDLRFGMYPEVHLEGYVLPVLVEFIAESIAKWHITEIYTHHWADLNQDHRTVAEATMIAARPFMRDGVQRVLAYEVDPVGFPGARAARGSVYRDITPHWKRKLLALKCYASELRFSPHPRSEVAMEARARSTGVECGCEMAEVFEPWWMIDG